MFFKRYLVYFKRKFIPLVYILHTVLNSSVINGEQQCSILSTSINEEAARGLRESGIETVYRKSLKEKNKEYFKYKPEFPGNDYIEINGSTPELNLGLFGKDKTFEFCARFKGAITHHKHKFYCCGGSSAYHFEKHHHHKDDTFQKNFLPCFSRSSASVKAKKNTITFSSSRNVDTKGWTVLYRP